MLALFALNADGFSRALAVGGLLLAAVLFTAIARIALWYAFRPLPPARDEEPEQQPSHTGMVWIALALAAVTGACADGQAVPVAGSSPVASAPFDGSALVSTQSLRDQPPVSTDDSCPSGELGEFKMNPLSAAPALVLPQGLRPTNLQTGQFIIQWARKNDEKPINGDFGVKAEETRTEFIELLDWQPLRYRFNAGSFVVRAKHLCKGGGEGKWTPTTFSVDDPPQGSAAPNGPWGQCAVIPTAAPCVREG
jgi:hypothetical protein